MTLKLKRMDNVLIVVDDLEAVKAFFIELGLKLEGETTVEGPSVGSQGHSIDYGSVARRRSFASLDTLSRNQLAFGNQTRRDDDRSCGAQIHRQKATTSHE
jgi:hypothetical protein